MSIPFGSGKTKGERLTGGRGPDGPGRARRSASSLRPFGSALLLVGLATGLTALLWPRNRYEPFGFYYLAVWLATRLGQKPAGLLTAGLGTIVGDYFFVPPRYSLIPTPDSVVSVMVFAAATNAFVLLAGRLQQAKDALRAGEERLRLAVAGARLGTWHWDLGNGELVWSPQCLALFGLPPDTSITYETFLAALHPEDRAGVDRAVRHALEARADFDVEFRTAWSDGSLHWVSSRGRGYYDASGRAVRMEGVALDINERKAAEAALRHANRQLSEQAQLLELAPVLVCDAASRIVLWTQGAQRLYGFSREEALGRISHELFQTQFPEPLARIEATLRRTGRWEGELVHRKRDGARLVVASLWTLRRESPEGPARILETNNDITGRAQAEAALRASEALLRTVTDNARVGLVMLDADRRHAFANAAYVEILGLRNRNLIGKRASEVLGPLYAQIGPRLDRAFAGERVSYELRVPAPPGSFGERFYAVAYEPLPEGLSTTRRVVVILTEVTERKRLETVRLENLRLESENRRIQEADRLKSEFLATMSHELRTPLNAIIGFTEVLSDQKPGPLNARQKEYLGDVLAGARHLLALITDVLALAEIEAGKGELQAEPIAVAPMLEAICALVRPVAEQKGLALTLNVAAELTEVTLDPQKLKQIGYNLLSNAVKFTPAGGRVELSALPFGEGCFELRVRDTGIGIKQEDLPRLFRAFEQLEAGAGRPYEGTGLGLALAKRLVELQGGYLEVKSEYGRGSTFSVRLPRALAWGGCATIFAVASDPASP